MDGDDGLAQRFEDSRSRLRSVAYRMLGSLAEADDAVQETWLRLSRTDVGGIESLDAWLTTVVGRVCLDVLRTRASRREESLDASPVETVAATGRTDPEQEALLVDSVGHALRVLLDTLSPVQRLAFVLHDLFAIPFDEIAPVVGRSSAATRQLASRARRRLQADGAMPDRPVEDLGASPAAESEQLPGPGDRQQAIVDAFLAAARNGEFAALVTMLDPDVVLRVDAAAARLGAERETRGADAVAAFFSGRASAARSALIDGTVGAIVFYAGQPKIALLFTVVGDRIVAIASNAEPTEVSDADISILT